MKELKFHKKEEIQRSENPNVKSIYSGHFKFITQNTAVYEDFCLIKKKDEIMKINTKCDKIFSRNNQIAILKNGKIDIFENEKLLKTFNVEKSTNIHDFLIDFENDIKEIDDSSDIFIVNNLKMVVTKDKVIFNGKEHINSIHESDCVYFVAWLDKIAILGNSKSYDFMYFYDGELALVEEYSPLTVRTDEESLDSIPSINIKFWGNYLYLIDQDIINIFTVSEYEPVDISDIKVVEYDIKDDEIVMINQQNDVDELKILTESVQNQLTSGSTLKNDFGRLLEPAPELLDKPKEDEKESFSFTSTLKSSLDKKDLQSTTFNNQSSTTSNKSIFDQSNKVNSNSSDTKMDLEIKKIDDEFNSRMNILKSSFKEIKNKKIDSTNLTLIPSKFDLDGTYNLIFNNRISDYEDVLSNMIFQIENLETISEVNILESIKFFNSKIFQKKTIKKPVEYTDPLCLQLGESLTISNPVDDLLEGIKILKIKEFGNKINFESKKPENINLSVVEPDVDTKTNNKPLPSVSSSVPQTIITLPQVNTPLSSMNNSDLSQSNTSIQPNNINLPSVNTPLPQNNTPVLSTASKLPNTPFKQPDLSQISLPFGAGIANTQPSSNLFNSSVNNQHFVSDTTSLFSNIASNSLNLPNSPQNNVSSNQQQGNTNPPTNESSNTPVSAFNRLAGSRKLFQ